MNQQGASPKCSRVRLLSIRKRVIECFRIFLEIHRLAAWRHYLQIRDATDLPASYLLDFSY